MVAYVSVRHAAWLCFVIGFARRVFLLTFIMLFSRLGSSHRYNFSKSWEFHNSNYKQALLCPIRTLLFNFTKITQSAQNMDIIMHHRVSKTFHAALFHQIAAIHSYTCSVRTVMQSWGLLMVRFVWMTMALGTVTNHAQQ